MYVYTTRYRFVFVFPFPLGRGKVLGGQSSEAGLALTSFKRDLPPLLVLYRKFGNAKTTNLNKDVLCIYLYMNMHLNDIDVLYTVYLYIYTCIVSVGGKTTPMYCMYVNIYIYVDISRNMCIKWYICIQVVPVWFSRARSDMNQRGKLALRNWSCEVSRAVAKWWPGGRFKWSNGRMVAVDYHQGGDIERERERLNGF